jgi:chromosome partitioning protein
MDIICPNCGIKRSVDDRHLPQDKQRITTLCRSCGHRFVLHLDRPQTYSTSPAPEDTQELEKATPQRTEPKPGPKPETPPEPEPEPEPEAKPKSPPRPAPAKDTPPPPEKSATQPREAVTGRPRTERPRETESPAPAPPSQAPPAQPKASPPEQPAAEPQVRAAEPEPEPQAAAVPPEQAPPAERPKPGTAKRPQPKKKARTIGVILSKGGVGKTTTSVNLAAGLALAGYKTLLVDTDTQGQSSYMLGVKPEYGLAELVNKEVSAQKALYKARERLWLLAGGRSLAGLKRIIDRKDFGGELTLAEALAPYIPHFDFIIVDSSPGWDPITVNVLFFVQELLVPVSLEVMSLQGLSEFSKSLATIQKYRSNLGITYILPTFLDYKHASRVDIYEKLKDLYTDYLCTPIRYDPSLAEAPAYGQTIYEYDEDSSGIVDYKALVRKVTEGDALI